MLDFILTLLSYIYVAVGVVLLFGAAIFFHEFGHYWVARRCGMKVEAFAIGFGPKIYSWVRNGIEYSIRWIPAGGFVKLPQMITSETLEGGREDGESPPPPASPVSKILVAVAGPLMNVVLAFAVAAVIYWVGLPQPVNPSVIGYVDPESEEAELGIKEGDRIVSIDGKDVSTWQEVQMNTALSRNNMMRVGIEQSGTVREFELKAEMNEYIGLKVLNLEPLDSVLIHEVMADSPAEEAGVQANDEILKFADVPIYSREQLIALVGQSAGETLPLHVKRDGQAVHLEVTPKVDPSVDKGRIGVALTSPPPVYVVQRPGPTPWAQVADVWDQTISTLSALFHHKETGVGADDLSGPVGILSVMAIQVNTDYRLALKFLVLLNINLAILNLLPLPVLDGGHIVMSLVEIIFRRRIHPRFQEYATSAFALLLISFMLYVTFFDIKRFSLFRALFSEPGTIEQVEDGPPTGGDATQSQP